MMLDHDPLRVAVVTCAAAASGPGPITDDALEYIIGAKVQACAVVGLDTIPNDIRTLLDNVQLRDDDIVDARGKPCPAPDTVGLKVIVALAWVHGEDFTELGNALRWLISMRGLAPRVMVAILDGASLPGFEDALAADIRRKGISLCYGPPNMISFLLAKVMRHVLTNEAYRVDDPKLHHREARS
jgi:hypothetical protein